ncbi:hypothetical protein UGMREWDR_CDS0063 [Aeromonas phage GomatiRiver_11]|nr:hypothetical protein OBDJBBDK_00058 [Aeromonas phage AhFM11]WKW84230.1 hypothetical protein UGMREWDR_CDS0063 [Aeromonas phage GomatiRiver_11]
MGFFKDILFPVLVAIYVLTGAANAIVEFLMWARVL